MLTLAFSSFAMTPTNDKCEGIQCVNRVLDVELGLEYSAFKDNNKIGLSISNVFTNSVGEALGFQKDDILIGIGNQPIVLASLQEGLNLYKAGDDVLLRIERNGRYQEIIAKMPSMNGKSNDKGVLGIGAIALAEKDMVGATVMFVKKQSAALYAGVEKNDIILGVDNQPIVGNNLSAIMSNYRAGDVVLLRIQRSNMLLMINTVLGKESNENNIQLSSN